MASKRLSRSTVNTRRMSRRIGAFESFEPKELLAGDTVPSLQAADSAEVNVFDNSVDASTSGLQGDLDGSGSVTFADFLILSNSYDTQVEPFAKGDVDGSGWVNFVDYLKLAENYGTAIVSPNPPTSPSEPPYELPSDSPNDPLTPTVPDEPLIQGPLPGAVDGAPRVVGAISTSTTNVIVTFSEPMGPRAELPSSYSIAQENVTSEAGTVSVLAARFLGPDTSVVELTTLPQNELTYRVTVVNARDVAGNPLQSKEFVSGANPLHDPTSATFAGTVPASAIEAMDTDGDGLLDNEEQRGRRITITLTNGSEVVREVTSNPYLADSDGDGLDDATESAIGTDPRDRDTDDDLLPDELEFNATFSDPASQDTDGDGLDDGAEFNFFNTSPILADTDGDQFSDSVEILKSNRNPRSADLPLHTIEIGDIKVELNVSFEGETTTGERATDTATAEHTLQSVDSREVSSSDTKTTGWFAKAGVEAKASVGFPGGFEASVEFTAEAGVSASGTHVQSEESKSESRAAHAETTVSNQEGFKASTVTRTVTGGSLVIPLDIKNAGDLTFSISDIELTALIPNPDNPTEFVPIGTLLPPGDVAETSRDTSFTLGTIDSQRGPFRFSTLKDDINPDLIDSLLANPRGIIVEVSNFNLKDEDGTNFAFRQQDVTERTAPVVIDFNNGEVERNWVAIGTGRQLEIDTDDDGVVDGLSRRTIFDEIGKPVGVSLLEALQDVIGLEHIDLDTQEDYADTDENRIARRNSFTTQTVMRNDKPVMTLQRIRTVEANPDLQQGWVVLTSDGFDADRSIDDIVLGRNEGVSLAFVQDQDSDGVPRRIEIIYGTSDEKVDTDGDGLDDKTELFSGYEVKVEGQLARTVFSDPTAADGDGDGLTDLQERTGKINATDPAVPNHAATDATLADTDLDGACDGDAIAGCPVDEFPLDPDRSGRPPLLGNFLFGGLRGLLTDSSDANRTATIRGERTLGACLFREPDRNGVGDEALVFHPIDGRDGTAACNKDSALDVYLEIPHLELSETFSLAFWLKPQSNTGGQWIIGQAQDIDSWFRIYVGNDLQIGGRGEGGRLSFGIPGTPHLVVTDPEPLIPNRTEDAPWTHFAIAVDGSSGDTVAKLFRNGQEVASTTVADTQFANPNDGPIVIGDHELWENYRGGIDDVQFFDGVLSATNVRELMGDRANEADG